MTEDLFTTPDPVETEETLRVQLTNKWKEKFPEANEELIRSKVDSDLYIKTLERQKDELCTDFMKAQEEIQKGKALEDLIDKLNSKETAPPANTPPKENTPPPSLTLSDVEKFYEDKKRSEIEAKNFATVQLKLQERFGQRAGEYLQEQAQTLGLTKEEVNSLAKKSPEAFFRTMGLNQQGQDLFMAPPRNDLRQNSFAPQPVKRDWNWYQDMKAKNPKQYWDPKTQLQMHRDAEALGAAFGVD